MVSKSKVVFGMKFLGPTLLASFKDSLPANEQVELDLNKPDELVKNKCKAMNLHAINLLTVMMVENDLLMLMMVESVKSKQPEWLKSDNNVASASIDEDDGEIIL